MKIITYNVNGLRAAVGKGLPEWLAQEQPYVLCLQETKLQPEQYPAEAFEALGYKAWLFSAQKKGYSGVAILSRREPDKQEYTWWSYRFSARAKNKGWRIDYCMVSEPMKAQVEKAYILNEAVHSDHCPAVIEVS